VDSKLAYLPRLNTWIYSNQQAVPITVHKSIYHISHFDEFTTVLLHHWRRWKG